MANTPQSKVNIIYAEATGSFIVLLAVAERQGFFKKYGVDAQTIAARGAVVPRLTTETPIGMIGEPAALLQAAEGADLRIVASFSAINLSGHPYRGQVQRAGPERDAALSFRCIYCPSSTPRQLP